MTHAVRKYIALLLVHFDACALDFVPSWLAAPAYKAPRKRKSEARSRAMRRRWEARQEAWDAVRFELAADPAKLALFERIKGTKLVALQRAMPRASLIECFEHYVHCNGSELSAVLAAQCDDRAWGDYPVPTDEELDLQSLEATMEGWAA